MEYLEESRITQICSALKIIMKDKKIINGSITEAVDTAIDSMLNTYSDKMRITKIKSTVTNEQIIEKILNSFSTVELGTNEELYDSRISKVVQYGSSVGLTAAESICAYITQLILKSFHQSGSETSVASFSARMREIIDASTKRKTVSSYMFFKTQQNFDQIYSLTKEICYLQMGDIILDTIVIPRTEIKDIWYEYLTPEEKNIKSKYVSRFTLAVDLMYEHGIDIEFISKILKEKLGNVNFIPGPNSTGILDLFVDVSNLDLDEDNTEMLNINMKLKDILEIGLKGYKGIKQIYPKSVGIIDNCVVKEIPRLNGKYLVLNHRLMKRYGITVEKILSILDLHNFSAELSYPGIFCNTDFDVLQTIKDNIKAQKDNPQEFDFNRLFYAKLEGTNLREILKRKDIIPGLCYSTDFTELRELFGIEACRLLLTLEFQELVEDSQGEVNPRHIQLLFDLMTFRGALSAINFTGFSKTQQGIISKVSYERGNAILTKASGIGLKDEFINENNFITASNISTGIVTGQIPSQLFSKLERKDKDFSEPKDYLQKLKSLQKQGLQIDPSLFEKYLLLNQDNTIEGENSMISKKEVIKSPTVKHGVYIMDSKSKQPELKFKNKNIKETDIVIDNTESSEFMLF